MRQLSEKQISSIFDLLPYKLDSLTNILGQTVCFFEHPTLGGQSPILVHIEENGMDYMCVSHFYEITEMNEFQDYQPLLVEGKIKLLDELPEKEIKCIVESVKAV